MPAALDATHDPALESWVDSANHPETDFPIQNLPFGRFQDSGDANWRIGVAIGNLVLDLAKTGLVQHTEMHQLMRMGIDELALLRRSLSGALTRGSPLEPVFREALVPMEMVELTTPCKLTDFTDFDPPFNNAPPGPGQWMPIAQHGRTASIGVGWRGKGYQFRRPLGQMMAPDAPAPQLQASREIDFELELAAYIARPNIMGSSIAIQDAESHLLGLTLFNDWSARDLQAWESPAMAPFLSKNFAGTVSPWIVTLEALAPFRCARARSSSQTKFMRYLDAPIDRSHGGFDIDLEVWVQTQKMRLAGHAGDQLLRINAGCARWTFAQLIAHHTINGCNLRTGDLIGSGRLSAAGPREVGSLYELSRAGSKAFRLSSGENRTFLRHGDTVILRGRCEREGQRSIGFGECRGTVAPPPKVREALGLAVVDESAYVNDD